MTWKSRLRSRLSCSMCSFFSRSARRPSVNLEWTKQYGRRSAKASNMSYLAFATVLQTTAVFLPARNGFTHFFG